MASSRSQNSRPNSSRSESDRSQANRRPRRKSAPMHLVLSPKLLFGDRSQASAGRRWYRPETPEDSYRAPRHCWDVFAVLHSGSRVLIGSASSIPDAEAIAELVVCGPNAATASIAIERQKSLPA